MKIENREHRLWEAWTIDDTNKRGTLIIDWHVCAQGDIINWKKKRLFMREQSKLSDNISSAFNCCYCVSNSLSKFWGGGKNNLARKFKLLSIDIRKQINRKHVNEVVSKVNNKKNSNSNSYNANLVIIFFNKLFYLIWFDYFSSRALNLIYGSW